SAVGGGRWAGGGGWAGGGRRVCDGWWVGEVLVAGGAGPGEYGRVLLVYLPAGLVFEPVVVAAEAGEVGGGGGSGWVWGDVVEVPAAGRVPAAGEPAGDVAGADQVGERRGRRVPAAADGVHGAVLGGGGGELDQGVGPSGVDAAVVAGRPGPAGQPVEGGLDGRGAVGRQQRPQLGHAVRGGGEHDPAVGGGALVPVLGGGRVGGQHGPGQAGPQLPGGLAGAPGSTRRSTAAAS